MSELDRKPPVLLVLAAEGVLPVLAGCAGVAAAGPVGGMAGVAVGHAVERAINLFGRGIVARWQAWFAEHPEQAKAAVAELAAASPTEVRAEAKSIFLELAPDAAPEDVERAVEFLTAIPPAVDRALVPDAAGTRSVPPTVLWDDPRSLLQLLPEDVPPYPADAPLSGTPYRLRELLGAGGFGAVYRAESPSLQHLPLAIKFCLDKTLLPALHRERSNLERLMRAGGRGSAHVVRLYGYDLDHATPYLVYEFVDGGDLTKLLAARVAALGRAPGAAEVFGWVTQITEGLAFAHAAGLVHRDMKPANVLVTADAQLRLGDFGIGGIAAAAAAVRSRIGASTIDFLSLADQASLFRGAGTPLYMSPEQRRGAAPDPRHDLYALGVMWFQLLVGDVSRELPHGWAKELTVRYGVPAEHVALIERCVGWMDERPKDAGELLPLLRGAAGNASTPVEPPPLVAVQSTVPTITNAAQVTPSPLTDGRRRGLSAALARLTAAYEELNDMAKWTFGSTARWGLLFAAPIAVIPVVIDMPVLTWFSVLFGLLAVVVWAGYVYVIRSGVRGVADDLRKKAEALVDEVATDFPAEVADWGGKAALRHAPTVRRLRAELDPPPAPPPSTTAGLSAADVAADATSKTLLLGRLAEVRNTRKSAKDNHDGTWVAQVFLWMFTVGPSGAAAYGLLGEMWHLNHGFAGAVAVAVGVAVFALVWRWMAAVRVRQARWVAETTDRFAADYPRLVEAWGGRRVLDSPESLEAITRLLDPAAAGGRGGWLRRVFGG
ncbi:serine/threonine-protein kinase [Urbifossiella limnaea]|uniref:serine/threonine-protein kinase n=1 Tax=Urbifossiella limnaea TaxID=2528023 RepID=UPI00119EB95C|nr:serine/threonine-protein kinase [Urbifossiella limnaea]